MSFTGSHLRRIAVMVSVALLLVLTTGCSAVQQSSLQQTGTGGEIMVRTELFFGLSRPNGADVTDAEFAKFLTDEVTPRFPGGYSVIVVQGTGANRLAAIVRSPAAC